MKYFFIIFSLVIFSLGYFMYVYENGFFGGQPLKDSIAEDLNNKRQLDAQLVLITARDTSDGVINSNFDTLDIIIRKGITSLPIPIDEINFFIEYDGDRIGFGLGQENSYDLKFIHSTEDENFLGENDLVSITLVSPFDIEEGRAFSLIIVAGPGAEIRRNIRLPDSMVKVSSQIFPVS